MGMNTTVLIMNDFLHDIRQDEYFQRDLCDAISRGEKGEIVCGCKVIEMHHADNTVLVRMGYNSGEVVKPSKKELQDWCENNLFGPRQVEGIIIKLSPTQRAVRDIAVDILEKWIGKAGL